MGDEGLSVDEGEWDDMIWGKDVTVAMSWMMRVSEEEGMREDGGMRKDIHKGKI
jgi:hypothetical protein